MSAEVIRNIDAARAECVEVFADQYPYDASGTSLSAALIPGWLISKGSPNIFSFNMNETDVRAFMAQPWTMTSTDGLLLSDGNGIPHPRAYGTFPKKLRRYAIDDPVLTLEQAVHSMTGLTASIMRLRDRGAIRVGARADLVIFDPKTIRDNATYEHPRRLSSGVTFVVVNGIVAVSEGRMTKHRAGRVLSRAPD